MLQTNNNKSVPQNTKRRLYQLRAAHPSTLLRPKVGVIMHKDAAYSLYPPRGPMNGRRYAALVAVTLFCLLTFLSSPLFQFSPVIFPHFSLQQFRISKSGPAVPVCANLPGADQTLVVVKTGATEFIEKFPIHLKTTLQCYPNYLVFSDHEEIFKGEVVRNALDTVNEDVLDDHDEYELYRQLRDGGRGSLLPGQLSSSHAASDRTDRPGWKLDRWKFLPMLNQSYVIYRRENAVHMSLADELG